MSDRISRTKVPASASSPERKDAKCADHAAVSASLDLLQTLRQLGLLGKVWGSNRVLMGMRVCRWMRDELAKTVSTIVLVGKRGARPNPRDICQSLMKLTEIKVILLWRRMGQTASLSMLEGIISSVGKGFDSALIELDLSESQLRAEGASKLAELLGGLKTLSSLSLGRNELGAKGTARVCKVLGDCRKLALLDLGENAMGPDGAQRLAKVGSPLVLSA
eukprot:1942473-Rhodomonas_salina.1